MCNFCEKYMHKTDHCEPYISVDPLYDDFENDNYACVTQPTPISIRKHREDGLTAQLTVSTQSADISIPIRYCPICGRDLTK